MNQSHLNIEKSEQLTMLKEFLEAQNEADGLMDIIRNPQFEFSLNLTSRMLNYHESQGFIRFHREGKAGKRRFSFVNALGFQFSQYLKRNGINNNLIAQLNEMLNEKGKHGVSDWDLVVYYASVTIGLNEIWVKKSATPISGLGIGNDIELTTTENEDYFHLSKILRETFYNGQGNLILTGKTPSFLPKFVFEIDKVRDQLGWDKLSPDNFKLVQEFGEGKAEKFIDSNAVMAINNLPVSKIEKMYDIIHQDEKGNWYGIDIKSLRINPGKRIRFDKLTKSSEELAQAIEDEIKFLQKMRDKLSKGS